MSHTSSVLSKTSNEDILKMDYYQALMLEGGLKNLSKQQANEFSQKISILQEHVKDLILNREAYKQKKFEQIAKKYCQSITYGHFAKEDKKVTKKNLQQVKQKAEEPGFRKPPRKRQSQLKSERLKVQESNQSQKVITLLHQQQPTLFENFLFPLFKKANRHLLQTSDVKFTQKRQVSPISQPQEQQEQQLLRPYSIDDFEKTEKKKND